ncbi:unnamed protein product [Cylicocyclus nassatus]|uniref:Uncharacterized protein n=1 Tax=Cylicocyclus nassatus TaxID=53992 RepID=A0AA36GKU3_CYLNA|nr:unnamed protein product [Cylicocyclus nassatus]
MTFLEPALRLLEVIEQGNFEEGVLIANSCDLETDGRLALVAQDLIYKVAYSFGNENNSCLKLLLIRLFDSITNVPEKFQICYELLVWRTSPLLTDVLVNQLGLLITENFVLCHPELWEQVCEDLPIKLERRLCERLASSEEDLWYAIVESAHVLAFFDKIPFRVPYKFGKLVDGVLNEIASDEAAAYPFLVWYAREHPFSPKLLGHTEPTVLIPNVYDLRFLQLRLVEGVCEYIKSNDFNCVGTVIKPLANAVKFLHKLCYDCRDAYARHIDIYAEMFALLLRFIEDFDVEPHKYVIIKKSQDIILCFPLELRVLLLRNVIKRIVSETHLYSESESKVLAWLLDQMNQDLCEKICAAELGSIFGLLEHVTYDDIPASTHYYSSVVRIVKAYACQCVNLPMLAQTRERIIVRIRDEIVDYLQKLLNGETRHLTIDGLNNDVHPSCGAEPGEQSVNMLYKIVGECEETMAEIDSILSRPSEVH